jgi:iron complex transport system substrate-binding protein
MRICSFLPSATEIVFGLGLGDHLHGVTYECDFPPEAAARPVVIKTRLPHGLTSREIDEAVVRAFKTGQSLYEIDAEALRAAKPDLILTQELCDVCAISYADVQKAISSLPEAPRLVSLRPHLLGDVYRDILTVGEETGRQERARAWVEELTYRVGVVRRKTDQAARRPRVFCMEWTDPIMASGHWMPQLVELAGGVDRLGSRGEPSGRMDWERVRAYAPEVLILMPCGYDVSGTLAELPLLERLDGWETLPAVRSRQVYAVNGHAYYSRSGPRLVDGVEILAALLHPDRFPEPPLDVARRVY